MHGHLYVKFDYPTRLNQETVEGVKIEAERKVGYRTYMFNTTAGYT